MRVYKKIIIVLMLVFAMAYSNEKFNYGQRLSTIDKYPPAIQRLDSIKSVWWKEYLKYRKSNKDYVTPKKLLIEYANEFISSNMYYTDCSNNSIIYQYFSESYPIGGDIIKKFQKLPYPYSFLIWKKGVLLGEAINDEVLPKKSYYPAPPPPSKKYNLVAKIKVIDDIFNTCDSDTILIRHDNNLQVSDTILFSFKIGGTIQRVDSVQWIYLMGKPKEFMYVDQDGIIHDPNKVLKIEGKKYSDFKQELLDFVKQQGIRR